MQLEIGFSSRVDMLCNILSLRLLACRANGSCDPNWTKGGEDREKYSKRRVWSEWRRTTRKKGEKKEER